MWETRKRIRVSTQSLLKPRNCFCHIRLAQIKTCVNPKSSSIESQSHMGHRELSLWGTEISSVSKCSHTLCTQTPLNSKDLQELLINNYVWWCFIIVHSLGSYGPIDQQLGLGSAGWPFYSWLFSLSCLCPLWIHCVPLRIASSMSWLSVALSFPGFFHIPLAYTLSLCYGESKVQTQASPDIQVSIHKSS